LPFGGPWTLRRGADRVVVSVPARVTINNSAAILAMVEAGGSLGLVPDFTARAALAEGRVVQVLPDWQLDEPSMGAVHAVCMPGKHLALKVRAFIDYLVAAHADGS
jgi:DNA-binding transcriptional LysR family regulator